MNIMSEAAVEKALDKKMNDISYKMIGKDVSVYYGEKRALYDVNLNVRENTVTALIGPSGCGKSTFLRTLNRMNDTIDGCRVTGRITLDTDDIYDPNIDVVELRARVGMVAFVADVPATPMDPATALPVQIYMWANEAERAFVERTSGAIMVLLIFLILMNVGAILLRRRFERRW